MPPNWESSSAVFVDLLRAMVVPHQISYPVHRIYSICRSFVLMPIFS